jgi:hypothetical protein
MKSSSKAFGNEIRQRVAFYFPAFENAEPACQ